MEVVSTTPLPASDSTGLTLPDAALRFMEMADGFSDRAVDASPCNKGMWQHPPSFYCPISQQCLHDPVVLSDGHTYERRHIERWLQEHSTSPVSNEALPQKAIFPNHALRNAIVEYFQQVFSVHRSAIRQTIKGPESASETLGSNESLRQTIDALMQCSVLMNADLSTEVVLRQIMEEAKTLLGAEVASVFLLDTDKQELFSNVNSTQGELRVPIAAGIAGHVASTGEPLIIGDAYADTRFNRANDMKTGFKTRNMMCVPLKVKKDGVLGVVQLINKTGEGVFSRSQVLTGFAEEGRDSLCGMPSFTTQDLQFLQVFAAQAATAVANSGGLLQETQVQATHQDQEEDPELDACGLMQCCTARSVQETCSEGHAADRDHQESRAACSPSGIDSTQCSPHGGNTAACSSFGADLPSVSCGSGEVDLLATRSLAKQQTWRSRISRSMSLVVEPNAYTRFKATKVAGMLADATCGWQLDAFALAQATYNKPLSTLGLHLFKDLGLVDHFALDHAKVTAFFEEIEIGYDDANPYHNRAHAASVMHAMHALLEHGGILQTATTAFHAAGDATCKSGHLERMACLVAAAVHDFEHLGVTNDFLVRTRDNRAMIYNDQHVNENHHVAAAFRVLARPECNFLADLLPSDWRRFRELVIELVIATDMANSGKILKSFKDAFSAPAVDGAVQPVPASPKDAVLLLQMAMKCADLGHLALPWDIHKLWVARLEEEFFAQGDQEKERGHPVSFLMDRSQPGCSKTQTGFFQFVVIPLFQAMVSAAPTSQPVLDTIMSNYSGWQRVETEVKVASDQEGHVLETDPDVLSKQNDCSEVPVRSHSASEVCGAKDDDTASRSGQSSKRSGRARQRAAKWWATVRKDTPSPEYVPPSRQWSSPL